MGIVYTNDTRKHSWTFMEAKFILVGGKIVSFSWTSLITFWVIETLWIFSIYLFLHGHLKKGDITWNNLVCVCNRNVILLNLLNVFYKKPPDCNIFLIEICNHLNGLKNELLFWKVCCSTWPSLICYFMPMFFVNVRVLKFTEHALLLWLNSIDVLCVCGFL